MEGEIAVLSASLVGNRKLKMLHFKDECAVDFKAFGPLLSDASSVENIRNSNHTLEEIAAANCLPQDIANCLKLNKMKDIEKVIQRKIEQYYQT
jgi:hypothetical protein